MSCNCDDATTASDALAEAISGPSEMTTDAGTFKQHSLQDLIAADKYLAGKCAQRNRTPGFRLTKLVPPGNA